MREEFFTYFNIHWRFRNGVYILLVLISLLTVVAYFLDQRKSDMTNLVVLDFYEKELKDIKDKADAKRKKFLQKPFNPNFISDYKGYALGLSPQVLDKLNAYRAEGKWINSVQKFQQVTGVSDSLLAQIAPLFKFPVRKKAYSINKNQSVGVTSYAKKANLNTVTVVVLQEVVGLPGFIAKRIINYRQSLGGFVDDIQLQDVYGLYPKQAQKVLSLFTVKGKRINKRLDVNTASVKELMTVPYFDFEMALGVKDFIKEQGSVQSFYEFDKIKDFPTDKVDRIALYLKI